MSEIKQLIENSFLTYAQGIAQSRALIDVRDGLKPSLRSVLYANYDDGYTSAKKKRKFLTLMGSATRFYWHGDMSLYPMMIRQAKPFVTRYPLYNAQGSYGTLISSKSESAQRYVEGYLSELGNHLFVGLNENAIDTWVDNYDETDQYPFVLPSLGWWPLINGTMGIAVGIASSIPAFNLKEMNEALVNSLWGRPFNIPLPDFPTGATIINKEEVKESLKNGTGKSAKIRATIEYSAEEGCLVVSELPYATYTNTICEELDVLVEEEKIDRYIDLTGIDPLIKIYIHKHSQPAQVINLLYKETSLENHYSINLTMLKDGKYPQVFTLPEAMQEHLKHEFKCYTNIYKYKLDVALKRLHILEGYLIVIANIEEVVKTIKSCASAAVAKTVLTEKFELTLTQAEAVLKLTLSRIAALEVEKIIKEKEQVEKDIEKFTHILSDEKEIKKIIEKGLREVMNKYGDARRTKLLDLEDEENTRLLYFTPSGKVFLTKPRTETPINIITAGTPYMAVTRKGIAYRSDEVPQRGKKIFTLDKGDSLLTVQPAHEEDYLIIYSQDKSFRCLKISAMNKTRTKLSLDNIVDAFTSPEKMTKAEYLKSR